MNKVIADAELVIEFINKARPIAKAKYWSATDKDGNVTKVRVYFGNDKGYIELRPDSTAFLETVGRNTICEARDAVQAIGYKRVFA